MSSAAFQEILDQHAEEAAFLWLMRSQAVHAPNYKLNDLAELEERIDAHLEGLELAGEDGWKVCEAALELKEAGEVFAASILAIRSSSEENLARVLEVVDEVPETGKGLTSALGWHSFDQIKPIADRLLAAESAAQRTVGIATYAINRVDPGEALDKALVDEDPRLRARACKAAGELGATRTVATVEKLLSEEDQACGYWAAWAATLLGSHMGLNSLVRIAKSDSPYAERALRLAPRRLDPTAAAALVDELAGNEKSLRGAIIAAGAAGNPARIRWLIEQMAKPALARAAGESFSLITRFDLEAQQATSEPAEGSSHGSGDDPQEEDQWPDADPELPSPLVASVVEWWNINKERLLRNNEALPSKNIDPMRSPYLMKSACQRERAAVAWALGSPGDGRPLAQVSARAEVQKALWHN